MSVQLIIRCGERLGREGYSILPQVVETDVIAQLERDLADAFAHTPMGVGPFYGERTRRFGAIIRFVLGADHPVFISCLPSESELDQREHGKEISLA